MMNWRFYGRENELSEVRDFVDNPNFLAGLILGRRGIGKTELLKEARRRLGSHPPILIFELKDPALEDPAAANERLIRETRLAFGETISIPRPQPALFPISEVYGAYPPQEYFVEIIRQMLVQGVVVCLDEFHMAKPMKLEGALKLLIDNSGILSDNPPGKLILMGSHQQQVLDMFDDTEPLYGRAPSIAGLLQWKMPTLFTMAAEQGFLRRPGRMLTLWCAFGGVPGSWEQFAVRAPRSLTDFNARDDDDAWRMAFLDWHRALLKKNPRERFDSKAFIELAEPARHALLWLARRHPRGTIFSRFPAELQNLPGNALGKALDMLRDHLEMVERFGQFQFRGAPRFRISDNSTLYQANTYPELFGASAPGQREPGVDADGNIETRSLDRLKTLEGVALERLTANCLLGLPDVTWSEHGLWRSRQHPPGDDGPVQLADIDVMALRGSLDEPVLVMAGCKRNSRQHNTALLTRQFDDFLGDLGKERGKRLRAMTRAKLLVSPEFSPEQRKHYARQGFATMDILDMARGLGIEPEPAMPASKPVSSAAPEPDNSPSPF